MSQCSIIPNAPFVVSAVALVSVGTPRNRYPASSLVFRYGCCIAIILVVLSTAPDHATRREPDLCNIDSNIDTYCGWRKPMEGRYCLQPILVQKVMELTLQT